MQVKMQVKCRFKIQVKMQVESLLTIVQLQNCPIAKLIPHPHIRFDIEPFHACVFDLFNSSLRECVVLNRDNLCANIMVQTIKFGNVENGNTRND